MKYNTILVALLLTGCSTVTVIPSFPSIPEELRKPCEPLTVIDDNTTTLKELMKVVVTNYMKRHDCAQRLEALQEWHEEQRKLFEKSVKNIK